MKRSKTEDKEFIDYVHSREKEQAYFCEKNGKFPDWVRLEIALAYREGSINRTKDKTMKVIKDNFTIPKFTFTATCSICGSILEISDYADFHICEVEYGVQWDSYKEKHLAFNCCLCGKENKLTKDNEAKLPEQIINAVHRLGK